MRNIKYILILLVFANTQILSQELSLAECISTALKNNIDLKRTLLAYEDAAVNLNQAKSNRLPSANFNYNIGQNYGRSIDPFTNDYVNQQLTFSNVQINSNLLLFNGFSVRNEIKRSKFGQLAAELEKKQVEDEVALLVTQAYLEALGVRVSLELSEQRVEATRLSLEQVQRENEAGSGDPSTLSDFQGQYAADQLRVIDARNLLKNSKLVLFQLMNIDFDDNIRLKDSDLVLDTREYTVDQVYSAAMNNFEAFEAVEQRLSEARTRVDQEKSLLSPSVFLFAGINSNYSSAASRLNIDGISEIETGNFIRIDNSEIPVLERANDFSRSNISYGNQLLENISPNFGISVNYPIFSQNIQRNRISRAKIAISTAEIEKSQLEIEFRQVIEQAILAYSNTRARLELLNDQVEAFEESFRINKVKLENGVSNRLEYIISMNNLESAKLALANAKFDVLIQQKVIEFYGS